MALLGWVGAEAVRADVCPVAVRAGAALCIVCKAYLPAVPRHGVLAPWLVVALWVCGLWVASSSPTSATAAATASGLGRKLMETELKPSSHQRRTSFNSYGSEVKTTAIPGKQLTIF